MTNYLYYGHFKNEIIDYLNYRKNILCQTIHPLDVYLYQFDKYTIEHNITKITPDVTDEWLVLKHNECKNTLRLRAYTLKCFAKYLNLIGIDAYIIDSSIYNCKCNYIPHIYSDNEIKIFFEQINYSIKSSVFFPHNAVQLKLFFKLLYCTGMRDSEVLNLKYEDINLNDQYIFINNSKYNIDRFIYLDEDIVESLRKYIEHYSSNLSDYLFYNAKTNKKRCISSITNSFHKIINNCGFDDNKHRVHDFRHTFAVKNIKQAYEDGKDVYAFLPVLMTYMGHSNIISTEYYLRFTPDVYEKVTNQFQEKFGNVFPKIDGDNNE